MADLIADGPDTPSFQEKLRAYVKTQKGFLLAAEIALSFVVMVCYLSSPHGVLAVVPAVMMLAAVYFFGVSVTGLDKPLVLHFHWPTGDVVRASLGGVLYLVASVMVVFWDGGAASGAFGLIAGALYCYDAATTFLLLKSTGLQQNYNYNLGV